jgi:hypothetical protein
MILNYCQPTCSLICSDSIVDWLNLLITLIGFSLALFQLIKGNKEKSISNVIALKNEMSRYDHIHVRLLPNGEWENLNGNYFLQQGYDVKLFGDLVSYLGLFEIANEMIENGTLNIKQFNTFFSYRINNIFSNTAVLNYIKAENNNWKSLFNLYERRYK